MAKKGNDTMYCIGCGLCKSECDISFHNDSKGFSEIKEQLNDSQKSFVNKVCPTAGNINLNDCGNDIWGERIETYSSFAMDEALRKKASSGGTISAIASYLLENGLIDGVIHTKADKDNPIKTETCVSTSVADIIAGCGSRYCISSPWINLKEIVNPNKKYLAIGKPCDIAALRNAQDKLGIYKNIVYLISFFCAGMPSNEANIQLLKTLDCNENCRELRYRGNGWPGYTTAIDEKGRQHEMEYSKSWGGILGRDVHTFCRICNDGIGISADISCGDGWYIENGEPDFSERDGRNVTFARNEKGNKVLLDAAKANYISLAKWEKESDLKVIQKYQYLRRATMKEKILAFKLTGKRVPAYNQLVLRNLSHFATEKEKLNIFIGTVKRIVRHKI